MLSRRRAGPQIQHFQHFPRQCFCQRLSLEGLSERTEGDARSPHAHASGRQCGDLVDDTGVPFDDGCLFTRQRLAPIQLLCQIHRTTDKRGEGLFESLRRYFSHLWRRIVRPDPDVADVLKLHVIITGSGIDQHLLQFWIDARKVIDQDAKPSECRNLVSREPFALAQFGLDPENGIAELAKAFGEQLRDAIPIEGKPCSSLYGNVKAGWCLPREHVLAVIGRRRPSPSLNTIGWLCIRRLRRASLIMTGRFTRRCAMLASALMAQECVMSATLARLRQRSAANARSRRTGVSGLGPQ
ncbi:hypothetical protein AB4Y32_14240 [Paraburkholderia phymatum]|uniref:Uncharacterized protein n=1 Tax=Paraburkholderia phymatum TaxID=148447 RepID=A0ACC6TZZ4_9BURK